MSKPLPMTGGARDSSKLLNNANEFPFSKAQILQRIKAKERAQHDYQIDQKTMESKIYSLQNKKNKKVRGGGKRQQEYVETNRLETEANEPLAQQAQKSDEEMSQYSSDSREIQRQISRHKSVFFGKKAVADFSVDMSQWRDVPHPNGMTYALRRFQRVARKVINSMDAHQRIDTSLSHKSMIKFIGNDVSTQKGSEKAKLVVAEGQGCNFFTVWDVLVLFATSVFLYVVVFDIKAESSDGELRRPGVWGFFEAMYLIDIVVCMSKSTEGFTKKSEISTYLLGAFAFDFFALVPFHWIMGQYYNSSYLGFKLLRMSQIFRKCWSLYDAIKFLEYLVKYTSKPTAITYQVSKVIFEMAMSVLILHICSIFLLGINFVTGRGSLIVGAANINTNFSSFIEMANYVVYTFASVGYGNAYPTDEVGMIIAILYMAAGLLMFSYIAARVKQYFDTSWDYASIMHTRSNDFEAWLAKLESCTPNALSYYAYKGLREHYDNFFRLDISEVFNPEYFDKVSPNFRSIIIESFAEKLASLFPQFFKSVHPVAWVPLLLKLKFRSYIRDTVIISSQDIPPGLFFIIDGTVSLNHPNDPEAEILHFHRGTYFGDPVILLESQQLHVKVKSNLLKVYFLAYSDLVKNIPNASLQKLRVVALYKLTIMQMELRQFNCNLIQFLRNYSAKEYEASRVKKTGVASKKPVSVVEQIREQAAEVVQSEEPSAYLAPLDPRARSNRQETITGMMVRAVKKGEFDPRSCENPARNTIYNYLYTEPNTPSKRASASKGQAPSFSHPETVPVQLPTHVDTFAESSRTKKKIDKSIPEETKGEIELPVFRYKRMVIAEPEPEHIHHKVKPQIVMDTSSIRSVQIQVSYLDSPVLEKLPTAQFFDPQSPKNYLIPCPRSYRSRASSYNSTNKQESSLEDLTPELGSLGTSKLIQRFLTPRRSKTPSLGSERRLGLSSSPKGWGMRQTDNQQYVETDKEDEGQTLLLHKPQKNNCDSLGPLQTAATAPRVGRYKPNDLRGKQTVQQEVVIAEEEPMRNNPPVMFTPIVVLSETVSDAVMSDGCIHHSGSIGHNALIRENEPKLETVEMGKATDTKDYDMTIEPSNPRTEPTAARKLTFAPVTFQNLDTTRHLPNQNHLDPKNLPPPAQTETSGAFEVRTLIFSLAEDIEGMLKEYFCLDIKGVRAIISQASAKMDSNEHQDMAHIPDLLPIHSSAHALMQQLPEDPSEKITFADCLMRILQHKEIKDMDPFQLLGDLGDDGNGSKAGDEYKLHDEGDYLELSDTGSVDSDTFPTVCHNQGLASNPPPLCLSRTFSQTQSQARPGTPQFLRARAENMERKYRRMLARVAESVGKIAGRVEHES